MGKKHREQRKADKKIIRLFHYRTNEFGERRRVLTKADIRRRHVESIRIRQQAEDDIMNAATRKAVEDICAVEDALFVADVELALALALAL